MISLQSLVTLVTTHLATLVIDTGPGCQEDVCNDQVTLPAGREQGRPHPTVNTVHIRPIQQQNLDDNFMKKIFLYWKTII